MVNFFIYSTEINIILFELVVLFILLSNLWLVKRLGDHPVPTRWPSISVMIPARNEEINIETCVRSMLAQQYPNFEVLVLDDHSTDKTWQILQGLAMEDSRLKIFKGKDLPIDWFGKHWACHQMAQTAGGELFLFTDADTRHHPHTLKDGIAALFAEKADLLTAMPFEEVKSWPERLVVPLIPWSIFSFVPLALAFKLRHPALSAVIGQFMLFRKDAYEQIGGYKTVRQHAVDDIALGRRIKTHGLRLRLADATQHIHCRMYRDFQQVYQGISKNLFAAFDYKALPYLFVWLWLGFVFWAPLLILALGLAGVQLPPYTLILATIAIGVALLIWGITHWRFGFPRYLTFLYPVTILLAVLIAANSMVLTLTNRATWKGRVLIRPNQQAKNVKLKV